MGSIFRGTCLRTLHFSGDWSVQRNQNLKIDCLGVLAITLVYAMSVKLMTVQGTC